MGYANPMDDPSYAMWINSLNDISMYDVVDEFGIERNGDSIICPNPEHHDTHFGNCKIKNNRYYCFACNTGGDNISLIRQTQGERFMKAARILAERMGVPVEIPQADKKNDKVDIMPVTKEQLAFLGLLPGTRRVLSIWNLSLERPDDLEYKADRFGYVVGNTIPMSIEKLYREDPEGFYCIIAGKFREASHIYHVLYEEQVWNFRCLSDENSFYIKKVLESALFALQALAIKLTEDHILDLSYFKMPEIKKSKKKYNLQI